MATKAKLTAPDGADRTGEIELFAERIGLERAASGRYSILLTLGLYGGFMSGQLDPGAVVHEIEALEGARPPTRWKPPIQNKHPPLKGLWHKHYRQPGMSSLALNLQMALRRYGLPHLEAKVAEAQAAGEERYFEEDDIKRAVHDAVIGNYERRAADQAMTGEWLLYAQFEGQNYYLALATHDVTTHDDLRRQIDLLCCQEFPFLAELLQSA
ncbi:hypothetical protein [Phenylobacterium sp.]|uniref:hypothetical protein n=1 Tax=Phenylobacterium sp. TaxID=1871053 RepID=UPI002CAF66CF|nr:hypothetical protein [Phenylobacterium sp.]HLZ76007.1 hypothetical protein [Phenylobacterium sp.]